MTAVSDRPSGRSSTSPRLVIFSLWLVVFAASSQIMIISPILPQIGRELSMDETLLGTLVSAYSFMVGAFALIAGPISDKIGRRRILLLGTGAMSVGLALHAFVVGYASFLLVRVLAGAAGGILSGAAVAYIGDYFPYERRGWATGWVMSGTAFGQIAGIPLGIIMANVWGFRSPFYLFASLMGLVFLVILWKVPQPAVRTTVGRLTIKRALDGYRDLLKRPDIRAAAGAFGLMFLGVSLYVVYLPYWLEQTLDASATDIASLFLVGGIANVLTGPQAGRLSDSIGRKGMILASCVGLAVVMSSTTLVVRAFWVAYPLFFLTMVLVAMRISPFSALLTALVDDHRRGSLMSLTIALGQVGFAIGGALAGPVYARWGYGPDTWVASASVLMMGFIVWTRVPEPGGMIGTPRPAPSGAS